jgi:glycosyltransferase involved in cell wall biosynthesis
MWKGLHVARPRLLTLPGVSGPINPILLYYAVRPVLRRWRQAGFPFDVIDAQFFYPDGPAAAMLATEFGVPFSIKARGEDIHYWGARPECRRQILNAASQADGLLSVAHSLRQDMIAMGIEASKIRVHYTGVDLERFRPLDPTERAAVRSALNVAGPLVVSVGELIPRKAHERVIEAVAAIDAATLIIVGEGPEYQRLAALVRVRGLTGRVRLLGALAHNRIPALLAAADVFALASKSEGLANAWVEALACGTPVVISDVDGAREILSGYQAGRLLRERTPAAIAEAIREILVDPPARVVVRMSAARFTWERNTTELYNHLKSLKNPSWMHATPGT